jgi:hypothetical protein
MEISPRTVKRDWRKARAVLFNALRGDQPAVARSGPEGD